MRLLILVLFVMLVFALSAIIQTEQPQETKPTATFSTDRGEYTILLEIADEPDEWAAGLMNRTLREDEGMLFVFPDDEPKTFWMKDVPEPLDIIFFSSDWTVVALFKNLSPCFDESCPLYTSATGARYVIEVRGGFVAKHGVKIGDSVRVVL